jgi:hypothetical protein
VNQVRQHDRFAGSGTAHLLGICPYRRKQSGFLVHRTADNIRLTPTDKLRPVDAVAAGQALRVIPGVPVLAGRQMTTVGARGTAPRTPIEALAVMPCS